MARFFVSDLLGRALTLAGALRREERHLEAHVVDELVRALRDGVATGKSFAGDAPGATVGQRAARSVVSEQ